MSSKAPYTTAKRQKILGFCSAAASSQPQLSTRDVPLTDTSAKCRVLGLERSVSTACGVPRLAEGGRREHEAGSGG